MRHWNRALLALMVAGLLCGATTPSLAQQKKIDGKKAANGAPPAGNLVAPSAPAEDAPESVEGEPGLLPDAAPPVIPSLDYNYYYPQPGTMPLDQSQAQMYLCPLPYPPPYVGYTWISYPPFQPHEWLWIHARAYYRIHPDGGTTRTTIRWECH